MIEYRVRIRNYADAADLLSVTSIRGDAAPYIESPPRGDGASFDPLTADSIAASYTVRIVDQITSGTSRVVTSILEDGSQRFQVGFLKTYVESRVNGGAWTVLCAGNLTLLRLVSDGVWELTVQDSTVLQSGVELFGMPSGTLTSAYLALYPNRGCIVGGPILGTWLNAEDRGGWEMEVFQNATTGVGAGATAAGDVLWLRPKHIYGPPDWHDTGLWPEIADIVNPAVAKLPRNANSFGVGGTADLSVVDEVMSTAPWPGVFALVDANGDGTWVPWRVRATLVQGGASVLLATKLTPWASPALFLNQDNQAALTYGQRVRVRVLTIQASELSPIYLDKHPVDYLTDAWTAAGFAYDASACATVKASLGDDLRLSLRITQPQKLGEFLSSYIYKPFGIATRVNSSGQIVPFVTADFANTPPVKTIDDTMIQAVRLPFELDATRGLKQIAFTQKRQVIAAQTPDSVAEADVAVQYNNTDANALAAGTLEISVAGMVRASPEAKDPVDAFWLKARAVELFDRFGRSAQRVEVDLIRGDGTTAADTVVLGEEVVLQHSQLRNHNKRYRDDNTVGGRTMQLTRVTENPATRSAVFVDAGPNVQPIATVPTITIAKSTDSPRHVAQFTITNAAALNASGYGVRVQMAVTSGGAPPASQWTHLRASDPGAIPTTAVRMPAVTPGKTVYVRARSYKAGIRPSNWSASANVTLDSLLPVTTLVAAAVGGDGTLENISWANQGATTLVGGMFVQIWLRKSAQAFAQAKLVTTLRPGSTAYQFSKLTANTQYKASVRYLHLFSGDTSPLVEVTFTTDATTPSLTAPLYPDAFVLGLRAPGLLLKLPLRGAGKKYGLAVVSQSFPCEIEFAEAVETAVGSGVYGSFATVGTIDAVQGDWTIWGAAATDDGLRRQLKARAVREAAVSAYTAAVTVDFSVTDAIAAYPIEAPICSAFPKIASRTRTSETVTFTYSCGPHDTGLTLARYKTDDGAWTNLNLGTNPATADVAFTRAKLFDKHITLEVTQSDGQTKQAFCNVPAQFEALDDTTGRNDRTVPHSDGDYAASAIASDGKTLHSSVKDSTARTVAGMYHKASDTADQVQDGSTTGVPHVLDRAFVRDNTPSHGQNLLRNGGFELGTTDFWALAAGTTLAAVNDSTQAHTGNWYATITSSATRQLDYKTSSGGNRFFEVQEGDAVQLSAWLLRSAAGSPTGNIKAQISFCDKDKGVTRSVPGAAVSTNAYTKSTAEDTVAAGEKYIRVQIITAGVSTSTTFKIDDVVFKILRPADDVVSGNLRSGVKDSASRSLNNMFLRSTDDLSYVQDDPIGVWRRAASVNASNQVANAGIKTTKVVVVLTSTGASPWTVPADFNPLMNSIELIAGGGCGEAGATNANGGGGGGGGEYVRITNFDPKGKSAINYTIGAGGSAGSDGGDTKWNNSDVVAKGGKAGGSAGARLGGLGGGSGTNVGSGGGARHVGGDGGNGSNGTNNRGGGGGGGAAGAHGDGVSGSSAATATFGAGGNGAKPDSATGGATSGAAGAAGTTDPDAGGGGAGRTGAVGAGVGGTGGTRGGGGGGGPSSASDSNNGGPGAGGVIVITYYDIPNA